MPRSRPIAAWIVCVAATSAGCVIAAAGAGAGGGIYLTSRGVESVVTESPERVAAATERALEAMGLRRTGLEIDDEAGRRTYRAEPAAGGDPGVTVTLEAQESGSTRVEVTARTSAVTWDKDYARTLLERIAEEAGS